MYQLKDRPYFSKVQKSYFYGIVKTDAVKADQVFVQPERTIATDKEVTWGQMVRLTTWVDKDDLVEL